MVKGDVRGSAPGRVRLSEVLRYLGYTGQKVDSELLARIEDAATRCDGELEPRWAWRAFPLKPVGPDDPADSRAIEGARFVLTGSSIASYLAGASEVALLACTLGAAADRRIGVLGAIDPLEQLVYDAACSDLVEWAADAAQGEIAAWAAGRGLGCGRRFSPGYGDFALSAQPALLEVLDAPRRLGLTASRDNLLVPTKSVTAVLGLYPGPVTDGPGPGCALCAARPSCAWLARGIRCHRKEGDARGKGAANGPANFRERS